MPRFQYQARDSTGHLIAGIQESTDERSVAGYLARLGYQPIQIQRSGLLRELIQGGIFRRNRVDRREVLILLRELAALLRSGIPLATGLEGLIQQTESQVLRRVLTDVSQRVKAGASFSESLAVHPEVFPELVISMVRVGEVAGILDRVLDQLAQLGAQELETRSRISSAMIYPVVLMVFALLIVNGLLIGVLPKFITVFEASKVPLPWPTRFLLLVSFVARRYGWLVGLIGLGLFGGMRRYLATPEGRLRFDRGILGLPVMGGLFRKILIARVAHTLGAMLRTGVPLLEALSVTEKTLPNTAFQRALQKTRAAVAGGESLTQTWSASGLFPPLVLQMVSVGERTGQLDSLLMEVAAFYDPDIDLTIRNLTTLLEPILLVAMGLFVGLIALSVLLPIFQLIHVFKR